MEKNEIHLSSIADDAQECTFPCIKHQFLGESFKENAQKEGIGSKPRVRVQFGHIVRRNQLHQQPRDNNSTLRMTQLQMQNSLGLQLRDANKSVPTEVSPPKADLQKTYRETRGRWDYTVKPSPSPQPVLRENMFKVYSKKKVRKDSNLLPVIQNSKIQKTCQDKPNIGKTKLGTVKQEKVEKKAQRDSECGQSISLRDLGIFSMQKGIDVFLRSLKHSIGREFMGQVNLQRQEEVNRLQFLILKEIHHQGRWL